MRDKGRLMRYLAIVVSIVVASSVLFLNYPHLRGPGDDGPSGPDPPDINQTYNYTYLNFTTNYTNPSKLTQSIQHYTISGLSLDNKSYPDVLKTYNMYYSDNNTTISHGDNYTMIRNGNNTTMVRYHGFIDHNNKIFTYTPVTLKEIDSNKTLLDKAQAYQTAITYLKDHGLHDQSWELFWNTTRVSTNVLTNITLVKYYKFKFIPVLSNLPIIDSDAPMITIKVNPLGELVQCKFILCNIQPSPKSGYPTWTDPAIMLEEVDRNITKYMRVSPHNHTINVSKVRLGYRVYESDASLLMPTWFIYYGEGGRSVVAILNE
jgi:hypothetical protein